VDVGVLLRDKQKNRAMPVRPAFKMCASVDCRSFLPAGSSELVLLLISFF
jgi:hypothetical protein